MEDAILPHRKEECVRPKNDGRPKKRSSAAKVATHIIKLFFCWRRGWLESR